MALTPKENFLRYLRGEPYEFYPNYIATVQCIMTPQGFRERPKDDQTGKDWFGIDWVYEASGNAPVPDPRKPAPLSDISEWREKVVFPDLDAWDWETWIKEDNLDQFDRENKLLSVWISAGPFERFHYLLGFENALVSLMTEPEESMELIQAIMDHKCRVLEKVIEYYKPDMIQFHDDWGNQQNLFFSPDVWRKFIKPQIKRGTEICHKHGVIYEQHSCGKIDSLLPELVDIGVDAVFIMGINDIPKYKAITKNKLAYNVSTKYQEYYNNLLTGKFDEEKLRAAVRNEVFTNAKGGYYSAFVYPSPDPNPSVARDLTNITFDEVMKNLDKLTELINA